MTMNDIDDASSQVSQHCQAFCDKIRAGRVHECSIGTVYSGGNADANLLAVIEALSESQEVKTLNVDASKLSDVSCVKLSTFLASSHGLESVFLYTAYVDADRCVGRVSFLLNAISSGPALRSLILDEICSATKIVSAITKLLSSANSPKTVVLYDAYNKECSAAALEQLGAACQANQSVEELSCGGFEVTPLHSCLVQNLINVKTINLTDWWGTSACLSDLIRHSPSLQTLTVLASSICPQDWDQHLKEALTVNQSLRHLILGPQCLRWDAFYLMGEIVRAAGQLESVQLECSEHWPGPVWEWEEFVEALKDTPSLQELTLLDMGQSDYPVPVGALLRRVPHLHRLCVGGPTNDAVKELAAVLPVNHTLLKLEIIDCEHNGDLDSLQLMRLLESLPQNETLKSVRILFPEGGTPNRMPSSVVRLLRQNVTLTALTLNGEDWIGRLIARNQGLEALDYGIRAQTRWWPRIIQVVLQNEYVGPSKVFRLLKTHTKEIIAPSTTPSANAAP